MVRTVCSWPGVKILTPRHLCEDPQGTEAPAMESRVEFCTTHLSRGTKSRDKSVVIGQNTNGVLCELAQRKLELD